MPSNATTAISNLEYDLITVLQHKSEAVKTYDTYIQDAQQMNSEPCVQLLQKLQQEDMKHAEEVRHHLQEVMQKGKM